MPIEVGFIFNFTEGPTVWCHIFYPLIGQGGFPFMSHNTYPNNSKGQPSQHIRRHKIILHSIKMILPPKFIF